jgi:hypothetical protein
VVRERQAAEVFTQVNTDRARLVRPYDDGFQVVAGHHRLAAARAAGLDVMPCWVEEMDDEVAFLELVRSNRQSELTPLERGMHALKSGLTVRAAGHGAEPHGGGQGGAGEVNPATCS